MNRRMENMQDIRPYEKKYLNAAREIWNDVVRDGNAFPQLNELTEEEGDTFFSGQSFTGIAVNPDSGEVTGL